MTLPIIGEAVLSGAWRAAWRYTPGALAQWREDIAAEVALVGGRGQPGRCEVGPAHVWRFGHPGGA